MSVNTAEVFCSVYNKLSNDQQDDFQLCLRLMKEYAVKNYAASGDSLKNVGGAWYAWLLAIGFSIEAKRRGLKKLFLKLPNVRVMPCTNLYNHNLTSLLKDFEEKLYHVSQANLITSNPDFVVIRTTEGYNGTELQNPITTAVLENFDTQYQSFEGNLRLGDLEAYIGVKTSLRPDRRIQLLHEGSLMKAIHTHLVTRNWDITAERLRYYGISLTTTAADVSGLKSVATHSIITAGVKPERAVDALVEIPNAKKLSEFIDLYNSEN